MPGMTSGGPPAAGLVRWRVALKVCQIRAQQRSGYLVLAALLSKPVCCSAPSPSSCADTMPHPTPRVRAALQPEFALSGLNQQWASGTGVPVSACAALEVAGYCVCWTQQAAASYSRLQRAVQKQGRLAARYTERRAQGRSSPE